MAETAAGRMAAEERLPPQNLEAERAVLGAILQDKEALLKCVEILRAPHFYRPAHQRIFAACFELCERNEPVDLITAADELGRRKELEAVGGAASLAELVDSVPTAANVAYHARIVRDKAMLRGLIETATAIVAEAHSGEESAEHQIDGAEKRIFDLSRDRMTKGFLPLRAALKGTFEEIEALYSRKAHVTGVPTGFREFDNMTGGFQFSDLVVIAGRPSMGKTSFCLNVALNAGADEGLPVGIFSLEMSVQQVVQRMLCAEARVEAYKLRTGRLDHADWPKLTTAAGRLSEAPIFIDDSPSLSILELRAKARRLKAEHDVKMIIIDYLQLLRGVGRPESRQQEVSEICRSLKSLAKELAIPVVALSQLSRAVEAREDKKPQLADLRESGAIEQDADLVAFIYRPGYYKAQKSPHEQETYEAEIIIGKQRNGPTGTVNLTFRREFMRFEPAEVHRQAPWDLAESR